MPKPFALTDGSVFLNCEAPGGIYNAVQLQKIAELSESGAAFVKVTEDQRIGLLAEADQVDSLSAALAEVGLQTRHYQRGVHQPVACLGKFCPQASQDALGCAQDLSAALGDLVIDSSLKIGINGCTSCCVATHTLDISIIGDPNGYRVSLGGKNSQIPEMATFVAEGVPQETLISMVRSVVELFGQNAEEDESLQDVMERMGPSSFIELFAPYSQDAAGEDDLFAAAEETTQEQGVQEEAVTLEQEVELQVDLEMDDGFAALEPDDQQSQPLPQTEISEDDLKLDLSDIDASDLQENSQVFEQHQAEIQSDMNEDLHGSEGEVALDSDLKLDLDPSDLSPEMIDEQQEGQLEQQFEQAISEELDVEEEMLLDQGDQQERQQALGQLDQEQLDAIHDRALQEASDLYEEDVDLDEHSATQLHPRIEPQPRQGIGFAGIHFAADGSPELIFASGIRLSLSHQFNGQNSATTLLIGQELIEIQDDGAQFIVRVGGLGLSVPKVQAA